MGTTNGKLTKGSNLKLATPGSPCTRPILGQHGRMTPQRVARTQQPSAPVLCAQAAR